jgi:hypothetical protein
MSLEMNERSHGARLFFVDNHSRELRAVYEDPS